MDGIRDANIADIQRASILSDQRFSRKQDVHLIEPKDPFHLVHLIFFFFGLVSFLSLTFFITANDFWMYKFRDVSQATYNSSNKTTLQTYFASATSITQSVPGTLMTFLAAFLGHKVNIRWRILGSLATMVGIYGGLTIFIVVDTDSWQLTFFIVVMILYVILNMAGSIFLMVGVTLISKFPRQYMKTQMYGQGASGLFSSVLQVISLSIGKDTKSSALIYFISGAIIVQITFILGYISVNSAKFRFYLGDTGADTAKSVHTPADIKRIARKLWLVFFVIGIAFLTMGMGHANITSLIVSENYGHGHLWNDKYFVPVATFLSQDVFGLLSRGISSAWIQPKYSVYIAIVFFIRTCLLSPLYMFCNARPRHHLPVWFPHDWEYLIVVALNAITGVWFIMSTFLSIPNFVDKDDMELGFQIASMYSSIFTALNTLLGPVFVSLL